jgi:hypothetical protein
VRHNQPVHVARRASAGTQDAAARRQLRCCPHATSLTARRASQVAPPAIKELCFFSPFKRNMHRFRPMPSRVWDLYVAAFSGHQALRSATAAMVRSGNRGGGRRRMQRMQRRWGKHAGGDGREAFAPAVGRQLTELTATPEYTPTCMGGSRHSFEACPFYLGERAAALTIRRVFPGLRLLAVLRNPRERTTSAFNDYVRVGRIARRNASDHSMEALIAQKISLLQSGQRSLEDFDMRMLTSGCYIHGLEAWGQAWPMAQLLVLQSDDLFAQPEATMNRVHSFLGLAPYRTRLHARNRNPIRKSRASRRLNETLDAFFAPYNERLYAWMTQRGIPYKRWANATHSA